MEALALNLESQLERYKRVLGLIETQHPYFYGEITRLKDPVFTDTIDTACVGLDRDQISQLVASWNTECLPIRYLFNPEFFDSLKDEELIFVIVHETMHVLFMHIHRSFDRSVYPDEKAADTACEIVINDWLVYQGFTMPSVPGKTGMIELGMDAGSLSLTEAYELLADKNIVDHLNGDSGKGSGAGGESAPGFDSHETWKEIVEELAKHGVDLEKMVEAASGRMAKTAPASLKEKVEQESTKGKSVLKNIDLQAGVGANAELRAVALKKISADWQFILKKITGNDGREQADWRQPDRAHRASYPHIVLPAMAPKGPKPRVLLAIDASGSVSDHQISTFGNLAYSIPEDKFTAEFITFQDQVEETTRKNLGRIKGGGGTSFAAVAQYASQMSKYPDVIVVITDGGDSFSYNVPSDKRDNWLWLIDGNTENRKDLPGTVKHMNSMLRKK